MGNLLKSEFKTLWYPNHTSDINLKLFLTSTLRFFFKFLKFRVKNDRLPADRTIKREEVTLHITGRNMNYNRMWKSI